MYQENSSSSSINQEPQPIHKVAKKPGKGVRLTSQTKYVIEKVRQFFEKEKRKESSIMRERFIEGTAEAIGLSIRSVFNIHNRYIPWEGKLLTPVKRYTTSRVYLNPDPFNKEVIQCTVHSSYTQRQNSTLTTILAKLKEDGVFRGDRFCLWKVLQ